MKKICLAMLCLLTVSCSANPPAPQADSSGGETSAKNEVPREAPALTVEDQDGQPVDFAKLYADGVVMVYFYPKADTPGCTAQACSLRDAYEQLQEKGVTIIGVSTDNAEAQRAFQKKYELPFVLVPDEKAEVLKAFGVPSTGGYASRQAFLVKDGQIVWEDRTASTKEQADDVLAQLKSWENNEN